MEHVKITIHLDLLSCSVNYTHYAVNGLCKSINRYMGLQRVRLPVHTLNTSGTLLLRVISPFVRSPRGIWKLKFDLRSSVNDSLLVFYYLLKWLDTFLDSKFSITFFFFFSIESIQKDFFFTGRIFCPFFRSTSTLHLFMDRNFCYIFLHFVYFQINYSRWNIIAKFLSIV